mmetsp:Transcript_91146/g.260262  ORF Transcript_91146/g.260262 Transcript_91146/m.260262 type:complete len:206 (-) Transcript_91146:1016-1633(-)
MAALDGADPLDDLTTLSVADLLTALTSNEVKPTDPRLEELKTALAQSGPAEAAVEEPAATAAAAVEEAVAPDATAAAVPETGRGCYLMAEETSGGTLNIQWSETAVEGAIAFCNPTKNVPKFKFTQNGGKRELVRGMRGPLVKNYYAGWLEFLKIVKTFEGTLIILMTPETVDLSIWVNKREGNKVEKLELGAAVPIGGTLQAVS